MPEEIMSPRELARALGGAEIVQRTSGVFTDDEALSIKSWDDISDLLDQNGYETVIADQVMGDGFQIMSRDDKRRLIGVPIHILDWKFYDSKMGGFVSARIVAKIGDKPTDIAKYRVSDGGKGIYKDLLRVTEKLDRTHSLSVRRGFRVSEYEKTLTQPDGKEVTVDAETYYLDISA